MDTKNCFDNFGNIFEITIDEDTTLNLFSIYLSKEYKKKNQIYYPENFKFYNKKNKKIINNNEDLQDAKCIGIMIIPIKCESIISNYLLHSNETL